MRRVVRDFFYSWKADLFRVPGERGRYQVFAPSRWQGVLGVLIAGLAFYYALFTSNSAPTFVVLAMAAWVLFGSLAELLPKERTTLAGFLRLGSVTAFLFVPVAMAAYFFLPLLR